MRAAVVAAPHFTSSSCPEEREGCSPVLQTHGLEGRPQPVRKPMTELFPGLPTISALRDTRASIMLLIPGAGSLLRRRHEHELRLARMQHQEVGIATDLMVQVSGLRPRLATVGAREHANTRG